MWLQVSKWVSAFCPQWLFCTFVCRKLVDVPLLLQRRRARSSCTAGHIWVHALSDTCSSCQAGELDSYWTDSDSFLLPIKGAAWTGWMRIAFVPESKTFKMKVNGFERWLIMSLCRVSQLIGWFGWRLTTYNLDKDWWRDGLNNQTIITAAQPISLYPF